MTAPILLGYICAALLLQLVVGVCVSLWRLRRAAARTAVATNLEASKLEEQEVRRLSQETPLDVQFRRSGTVRYAHAPDYDVTAGRCLLCVGMPESSLVLEA